MPRVSVCIPTYNYAHYIAGCIRSVQAQTYDDWELVIVDNQSSDNTEDVVRTFRDPRIHFHRNDENIGLVRNWNRCMSLANGEYVAILPADDYYLPRMLERSVAMLDAHPRLGFTHSSFRRVDAQGNLIDTKQYWESDWTMSGLAALQRLVLHCYVVPACVVMRRDCFREVGGFDEAFRYAVDWLMWTRLALNYDVGYVAEPLACERPGHTSSVTVREVKKRPQVVTSEGFLLLQEAFGKLPETRDWSEIRRRAYRNLMDLHVMRTLGLLREGDSQRFRSEIVYALRQCHSFPFRYRKMMVLSAASFLGADFADRLNRAEREFWRAMHGEPDPVEDVDYSLV